MSQLRTEILATLLENLYDVPPPRTKILATPMFASVLLETLRYDNFD